MSILAELDAAVRYLEERRESLGDELVDAALAPLLARRKSLGAPEEQRKVVTVLFADVSGFTRMSETIDPEEVAATMNFIWERVDREISARGGRVDKHIGDGVMALFGLPVSHPDDAVRAVRAALAMQSAVRLASLQLPTSARGAPLELRVGIHTGIVHAGLVPTTGEFTAIGDTVNLASRLEGAAVESADRHDRSVREVARVDPNLKVHGGLNAPGVDYQSEESRCMSPDGFG